MIFFVLVFFASVLGGNGRSKRVERKAGSKSLYSKPKQNKQLAKPFYFGGDGVLISDTKYVFIQRTFEYIFKVVYNIETAISGTNTVEISNVVLDKKSSTFHFSEEQLANIRSSCGITSSKEYTYEELSSAEMCEDMRTFVSSFVEKLVYIPSEIKDYRLESVEEHNYVDLYISMKFINNFNR